MTKRMLIDASHAEETRVVVLDGTRLEEFDLEAATRRPLKGNIYLAKVVRVEPSLQAAFVEYGGNRHGFLAFGEIHPDYYQIPVADRQRLLDMQAAEAREEDAEDEADAPQDAPERGDRGRGDRARGDDEAGDGEAGDGEAGDGEAGDPAFAAAEDRGPATAEWSAADEPAAAGPRDDADGEADAPAARGAGDQPELGYANGTAAGNGHDLAGEVDQVGDPGEDTPPPEIIGGEGTEDVSRERRNPPRFMRHYKIQEVIRRRQIMLVQVVKEERGTKGAALTTYISLAGRFSVIMPNSPRGGGVSRKITSANDRKRLREVIDELGLPQGMSLIVRTAGAQRPKPEIRRDCEYLLRLWDNIRERTLSSTAPALIYEEADLIKRSIRDVFSRDVEEIVVDGEDAFREAREFMRMLMPQNARKIHLNRDGGLFARHSVEAQLDAMHNPTVQLRSGGYLVINQTEALVAIDVNSGRSTRERHIEDTALRTNLEAADEIARQLRLRDLAGLIVIDFIDMESSRHDAMVERRLKEALRHDRARIQVGRISHFGLMEMSRQRLRPSLTETTFVTCPHCQGRGNVRSIESGALQVLRAIEEEGAKRRAAEIAVHVHSTVALYLLNRKRDKLAVIEARFGMAVVFEPDDTLLPPTLRLEKLRAADPGRPIEAPQAALRMDYAPEPIETEDEPYEDDVEDLPAEAPGAAPRAEAPARPEGARPDVARPDASRPDAAAEAERDGRKRKRRRRRRGANGTRPDGSVAPGGDGEADGDDDRDEEDDAEAGMTEALAGDASANATVEAEAAAEAGDDPNDESGEAGRDGQRRRRRGRRSRGGRPEAGAEPLAREAEAPAPAPVPRYVGPTPADPFAGHVDDILAAMEAAEAAAEAEANAGRRARAAAARPVEIIAAPPPAIDATAVNATMAPVLDPPVADTPAAEPVEVMTPPVSTDPAPAPPVEAVVTAPDIAGPVITAPHIAAVVEPLVEGPAIQPVSIDALDEAAPRRRGWWKR